MRFFGSLFSAALAGVLLTGASAGEKNLPLDNDFLIKLASCHNAEIEISKLADKRSASSPVKDFASVLIKDHHAAYEKLGTLLKTRKLGVVTGLEKETRAELKRLGALEGNDFDRAYLQSTIKEHKNAISMFENQVKNGKEQDIRSHAQEMLPDLRKHLSKAEELNKTVTK